MQTQILKNKQKKVLIFNNRNYKYTFMIGNTILEDVQEYKYRGAIFTKLNKFKTH